MLIVTSRNGDPDTSARRLVLKDPPSREESAPAGARERAEANLNLSSNAPSA